MNKEIFPKLSKIVANQIGVTPQEISPNDDFKDDLNVSDLELADIISQAEDTFGIEIDTKDAKGIQTVGDLVILIEEAGYI